jgi:hypothetical protein
MAEDCDNPEEVGPEEAGRGEKPQGSATGRRRVLMLGAVAASSVVTIRPALANTAGSVLNCKIPVPDPAHRTSYIAEDGSLVRAGTSGAFPPAPRPVTGEEARGMMNGRSPAGFDTQAREAYVNYIRKLQRGTSGFTCYASLQMPK